MGKKNRAYSIRRNYFYNIVYQILTFILPLITTPYTSRIFGAEGIGIYSYTSSIITYFCMFAALGTNTYGQREIAMNREDKREISRIFWEIELLSAFTVGVSLITWIIWLFFCGSYCKYYIAWTMNLIAVFFDISWFYAGIENFKIIVLKNIILKFSGLILLFLFINDENDLLFYIALIAATGLLGNISMWTCLPHFIMKVNLIDIKSHICNHMRNTLTYFVSTIAISVYTVLDKTMLGFITDNTLENGYYEQATKIVKTSLIIITSLNTVMASRMSWLFSQNRVNEIKFRLRQSMDYSLLLGIPMTFGLWGISKNFVPFFLGDGYDEVIPIIYICSLLIIAIGISDCIGSEYLNPTGKIYFRNKTIILGAVINFVLNLILIEYWGAKGAAIASVGAEGLIAALFIANSKEYINWHIVLSYSWKKVASSVIMLIVIIYIGNGHKGDISITCLQVLIGIIVYFISMLIMKDDLLICLIKRKKNVL